MMNERGKSDPAVVAAKLANKAERSAAEPVEPRAGTKGNANQQHSGRTQSRETRVTGASAHTSNRKISDLPLLTRGRSRMRESRTYGSVRGAGSNLRPYRDRLGRRSKSSAIRGRPVVELTGSGRQLLTSSVTVKGVQKHRGKESELATILRWKADTAVRRILPSLLFDTP